MNDIVASPDEAEMKARNEALADAVIALLAEMRRELREGLRGPGATETGTTDGDEEVA